MDPIASDINVNTALPWSLVTSIRKPSLDTMLEVSKAGQIQSDHPWLVAQQLLEEAEQTHHFLPILLVVSDGSDLKLSHWGGVEHITLLQLSAGRWESRCRIRSLSEIHPIWCSLDSLHHKPSEEQLRRERDEGVRTVRWPLQASHIQPYGICETPAFIEFDTA